MTGADVLQRLAAAQGVRAGGEVQPRVGVLQGVGVQILTPPSTSTVFMKLVKSTSR